MSVLSRDDARWLIDNLPTFHADDHKRVRAAEVKTALRDLAAGHPVEGEAREASERHECAEITPAEAESILAGFSGARYWTVGVEGERTWLEGAPFESDEGPSARVRVVELYPLLHALTVARTRRRIPVERGETREDQHYVELEFNDGLYAKLICPPTGCERAEICGKCGRAYGDTEIEPCYDCKGTTPDECWIKTWFDNETPEELLKGKLEPFPIDARWRGDRIEVNVAAVPPGGAAAKSEASNGR